MKSTDRAIRQSETVVGVGVEKPVELASGTRRPG